MNNLGPEARAILDAARHLDDPRPSDRARVRRSLFARVAAGSAATLLTTSAAASPLLKLLLPAVLVVGAGVGGTVWWRAQQQEAPVPAARIQQEVAAPVPAVVETPPAVVQAPVAAAAPAPRPAPARGAPARSRAVASSPRNLNIETGMLAEANEALRDGDVRLSLSLLDEYDRRFPAGVLRQEMTATRIIARCQLSPSLRNREAARLFLAQYPASPLASRVRSSCKSIIDR